jgi:ABC-type multidrug transport system ATPase subunit
MSVLRRYELDRQGDQRFEKLSGGQQARFQILQLELQGATLLLLDEPTDNLDLESAEALQEGLEAYEGTVLAVTHDRWFAQSFDRYLFFSRDGSIRETSGPVWDESGTITIRLAVTRGCPAAQAARRRTSQTVAAMSSTDSASSQPPSIHWNGQNRLPGW